MKAVTPVIALVMLLLITVGIVGASYAWFGGIMSSQTKKSISIPPGGAYCSDGDIKAYVLNNGDTAITASDIIVAQVDGVDVKNTPFFGDMRSGLVGYWKFDETSGTTAKDSSGNNNNGDLKPACPNCPTRAPGKSRNALAFDGVDDYVSLAETTSLSPTNAFTVEAWAKPNDLTKQNSIFYDRGASGPYKGFILALSGNQIWFLIGNGVTGTEVSIPTSYYTVTTNWQHIVYTYDGSATRFYVNGIDIGYTYSMTGPISYSGGMGINIGEQYTSWGDRYFNGLIDEVKIYNKAVGDVSVQPSSSGLLVNYPGMTGRHTVRVGTSSGVAESTVTCE